MATGFEDELEVVDELVDAVVVDPDDADGVEDLVVVPDDAGGVEDLKKELELDRLLVVELVLDLETLELEREKEELLPRANTPASAINRVQHNNTRNLFIWPPLRGIWVEHRTIHISFEFP